MPRGVYDRSNARFRQIAIVPTYATQFPELVPPPLAGQFLDDLDSKKFTWLIDRLQTTQQLDHILFRGGEPTLWGDIDRAIYDLRQRGIGSSMQTNGIRVLAKSLPDKITISLHTYIDHPEARDDIRATILHYKRLKLMPVLAYFRRRTDTEEGLAPIFNLARQVDLPIKERRGYTEEDIICQTCPYANLIVQPDGDTVTMCKFLPYSARIADYLTLANLYDEGLLPQLDTSLPPACKAGVTLKK